MSPLWFDWEGFTGDHEDPEVGSLMPRDSELTVTLDCPKHLLALDMSESSMSGRDGVLGLLLCLSRPSGLHSVSRNQFFHICRSEGAINPA